MPGKFTVYKDKASKYRFNLKASNGEIIAVGESYPDKKSALKGIASIVKNAASASIVDATVEAEASKTKPKSRAKPKSKVKPKTKAKAKAKPKTKVKAKPKTKAKAKPKAKPRAGRKATPKK